MELRASAGIAGNQFSTAALPVSQSQALILSCQPGSWRIVYESAGIAEVSRPQTMSKRAIAQ